jgi:glycosyltransferase involved in cell wall biosynthesis
MTKKRIVCFGPGPAFKGGIANYNTSLALTLHQLGAEVSIVSWTQQYPAIIPRDFKDKASRKDYLAGTGIEVTYLTNYNHPLTWAKTVRHIMSLNPDIVIMQWSIAIQGLPLGYMTKQLFKKCKAEIIMDCHLVVQKEGSIMDHLFSKMGLKYAHTYIAHAYKTVDELKNTFPTFEFHVTEDGSRTELPARNVIKLYHPVYDMFVPKQDFDVEKAKKEMGLRQHVFLFFGFIRKYKGLHQAIHAFDVLRKKRDDVSLLIVGESFWDTMPKATFKKWIFGMMKKIFLKKSDNEQDYRPLSLITELGMEQVVVVHNTFVPNEDVHKYFQVSDAIVLFYHTATPSGVESLSYNFSLPVLATKVGHFPETIKDGYNGYLAEAEDIEDMARIMNKAIEQPISRVNVGESAKHISWENYGKAIMKN